MHGALSSIASSIVAYFLIFPCQHHPETPRAGSVGGFTGRCPLLPESAIPTPSAGCSAALQSQCRFWVKPGNTRAEQMFSAPHQITDIARTGRHVGLGPKPDSCTAANSYSITSSARASNSGGTARPSGTGRFRGISGPYLGALGLAGTVNVSVATCPGKTLWL